MSSVTELLSRYEPCQANVDFRLRCVGNSRLSTLAAYLRWVAAVEPKGSAAPSIDLGGKTKSITLAFVLCRAINVFGERDAMTQRI